MGKNLLISATINKLHLIVITMMLAIIVSFPIFSYADTVSNGNTQSNYSSINNNQKSSNSNLSAKDILSQINQATGSNQTANPQVTPSTIPNPQVSNNTHRQVVAQPSNQVAPNTMPQSYNTLQPNNNMPRVAQPNPVQPNGSQTKPYNQPNQQNVAPNLSQIPQVTSQPQPQPQVNLQKGEILNNTQVNSLDDLTRTNLLEIEVKRLNQELDSLHQQLQQMQSENQNLKINLQKYSNASNVEAEKSQETGALMQEARELQSEIDNNAPSSYVNAHNLVIIGNLDLAQDEFKQFLASVNTNIAQANAVPNASNRKYIVLANYFLGRINNINGNYKDAVSNFSQAYKLSDFNTTSLLALIDLAKSLTSLSNTAEACLTLSQFNKDSQQLFIKQKIKLNIKYIDLVNKLTMVNQCDFNTANNNVNNISNSVSPANSTNPVNTTNSPSQTSINPPIR